MTGETDARLESLIARAESSWPDFRLERDMFADYLRQRIAGDPDDVRAEDLYLACACARGIPSALAAFEQLHMPDVRAGLRRYAATGDEVAAELREDLFYGRDGSPPAIAKYSGTGSLRGWLRVTATRLALKRLRRDGHVRGDDDVIARVAAPSTAPDLLHVRSRYGEAFTAAFQEAMSQLDRRDRRLLRQRYLDDLTGDEIATLHRVHRATILRWLAAARSALLGGVRAALARRLQVNLAEIDTIMRAVQSQLDLSLGPLLSSDPG